MTHAHAPGGAAVRIARKGRWRLAISAVLLLIVAMVARTAAAEAAVIPGAITGISTTSSSTSQYDEVRFTCQWAVPDNSSPGDTFTLQLPDQLRWFGATQFPLRSPDGQVVATGQVSSTGLVTFTLTDYVATHTTSLQGTCTFTTQYTATTTGGEVNLEFQVGADVIRVPLETAPPCTQDCGPDRTEATKSMWWTDGSQSATQTVVRAPATTTDTSTVVLTDVPDAGLALDCSTLHAEVGPNLDVNSDITDPRDNATYPPVVSCTPQGATVRWTGLPAGEYTELWVEATVVDTSFDTYTNRGTVTINGVDFPVEGRVIRTNASGTGSGNEPTTTPTPTTTTTTTTPTTTTTTTSPTTTTTTTTPTMTTTSPTTTTTSTTTTGSPTTSPSTSVTSSTSAPSAPASAATTSTPWRPAPPVSTGGGAVVTADSLPAGRLAFTGATVVPALLLGFVLVGGGIFLTASARRRAH